MRVSHTVREWVVVAGLVVGCAWSDPVDRPELPDMRWCIQQAALSCGPELVTCQRETERSCMLERGWMWVARVGYRAVSEHSDVRASREIEAGR